ELDHALPSDGDEEVAVGQNRPSEDVDRRERDPAQNGPGRVELQEPAVVLLEDAPPSPTRGLQAPDTRQTRPSPPELSIAVRGALSGAGPRPRTGGNSAGGRRRGGGGSRDDHGEEDHGRAATVKSGAWMDSGWGRLYWCDSTTKVVPAPGARCRI